MEERKYQEFIEYLDSGRPIQAYEMIESAKGIELFMLLTDKDLIRLRNDLIAYRKRPFEERYEEFIEEPIIGMERIYKFINEDFYKHDFDNIKNTAIDLDYGHYLGKYPHQGNGKIKKTNNKEWTQYISNDIANNIMGRYPMYNQKFGYI